ncbi:hypothetical protein C1J03_07825 [Sulfitobacter sp. SK012]|uniref:hypothetical protein n=1 Tax=Sulfitobacter sp. SK012 TaxID=1389005 RepID=UPI000E0A9733|nr:hypothetical protein [Sulfitobacter sp. SK012]AXI45937.1 hypothetical protein C1J03_07825 [Sulfitobacter sp. SK012]
MIDKPSEPEEILAIARASKGRRFLGLFSLGMLGVLVVGVALFRTPALEWRVFLLVVGFASFWMVEQMRRATVGQIELTETVLRDSDGTVIAWIDDIEGMDRGVFAFKPSNGFLLKTKQSAEKAWRPGMWWRMGRRIGIGGMAPGHHTKLMSEIIAVILARRDMEPDDRLD